MNPYQYDPEAAVASLIAKLPATADEIVDLIRAGNEEDALEAVARSVDAKGDLLETRWRLVAEHDRFMDELLARPDLGSQQPLGEVLTEAEFAAWGDLERRLMHNERALDAIDGWMRRMGFGQSDPDAEPLTMEEPDGSLSLRLR